MIETFVGGFFGDEGKGKETASRALEIILMEKFFSQLAGRDIAGYGYRYNGGPNGGHALYINDVKVTGHVLPSTILYEEMLSIVGAGCAVSPTRLVTEIDDFQSKGFLKGSLKIDDRVAIILDEYMELDALRGKRSTGSGIADVYGHQAKRDGIIARDLLDEKALAEKLPRLVNSLVYEQLSTMEGNGAPGVIWKNLVQAEKNINLNKITDELLQAGQFLKPFISNQVSDELRQAIIDDRPILNEGSQSYFLGIDSGIQYGSSSCIDPLAIFVKQNIPVQPMELNLIVKAFGSRVGDAYFVGEYGDRNNSMRKPELLESLGLPKDATRTQYLPKAIELMQSSNPQEIGDGLRLYYNEFGETTGRPRGKAPLDLVALRTVYERTARGSVNNTQLWINQVDGLEHFDKIPLITAYKDPEGNTYHTIPQWSDRKLRTLTPVIEFVPSWDKKITETSFPNEAVNYKNFIERETGFKIAGFGNGPNNGDIVKLV